MRLLIINEVCGTGSTGKICAGIAKEYEGKGYEVKIAYGRSDFVPDDCRKYVVRIGGELSVRLHALGTRVTDRHGRFSYFATKKFLNWAEEYAPDELWLHNLHGYFINYPLLFQWIKSRPQMKVKWTLHDCWAFTGHCSHFSYVNCMKWQTGCHDCPQKREYPKSLLADASRSNYRRKKQAFLGVKDMTLIVPSHWLGKLAEQSFLKEYPVEVRYNTIDTTVFKPTPGDFRQRYGLEGKKIILGVASVWSKRKGLDDFVRLAAMLDDGYRIVLVGLSKEQITNMPDSILALGRTESAAQLAEIYTAADVFLNLTYEDNYPTVNLEAQACGTPVITYRTGGSVESVPEENVVEQGDLNSVMMRIM